VARCSHGRCYSAIRPGYHLNKRHWNTITLDGTLSDRLVRDLIEDSYDLVVSALPKRTREQLGWPPMSTLGE
jgi:predicted DNA-binding protein (MmcQ/YjbR family)